MNGGKNKSFYLSILTGCTKLAVSQDWMEISVGSQSNTPPVSSS